MFKSWSKKNKIKAVFKLQFQATQVPKMKKSALMISLVPDDVGKTTVKLQKTEVKEGTCLWENPIFESVKLVMDSKSGKLHEKIYHFIVSTGSSKSGYLGEASIDFADFVAEIEPLTVSLPLKFANSGAILHVTIQNVEGYNDQRNGDEDNETAELYNDRSLSHQLSFCSTEDNSFDIDEDGTRSGYTDQNTKDGNNAARDSSFKQNNGSVRAIGSETHVRRRSNTDWSVGSASDGSLGDWTNSLEDNNNNVARERFQEHSEDSTEKLKSEIASLMRQVEVSELELQTLRRQVAKESSRGQNLSRQIISLREERDKLKSKNEQLESQKEFNSETRTPKALQSEFKDARLQLKTVKEELVYEKELNSNLQLQLQKTQNSNSELLLAVADLEAMLEKKNKEILDVKSQNITKEHDDTAEIDLLIQKIEELSGEIEVYNKQNEELNEHIRELSSEYELLKKENLDISLRLKQGEAQQIMLQNQHSASLATIEQLESQVEILEERIKEQTDEFSESLACISDLENQVKSLKEELKKQAEKYEGDMHAMKCAKTELEERAIQAEEALKKTRHNNTISSERFQEEYRMLSVEMASKVEENERMKMEAVAEADELRQQNKLIEEMLQKCNQELRIITDQNEMKQEELLNQIDLKGETIENMSKELENKSRQLEEAKRLMDEKDESFSLQIHKLRSEMKKLMVTEHVTDITKNQENKEISDLKKKEITLDALLSDVQIFKIQHNKLKHSMHNEQAEKENMKNKISQLQGELKKKESELSIMEKKLKSIRARGPATHEPATTPSSTKAHMKKSKPETPKGNNAVSTAVGKSEEKGMVGKTAQTSEVETCSGSEDTSKELMNEVAMLKDRNLSMEKELKEMEERYSEISLKFAEVEGERQQLVMALRNLKNGKKN